MCCRETSWHRTAKLAGTGMPIDTVDAEESSAASRWWMHGGNPVATNEETPGGSLLILFHQRAEKSHAVGQGFGRRWPSDLRADLRPPSGQLIEQTGANSAWHAIQPRPQLGRGTALARIEID